MVRSQFDERWCPGPGHRLLRANSHTQSWAKWRPRPPPRLHASPTPRPRLLHTRHELAAGVSPAKRRRRPFAPWAAWLRSVQSRVQRGLELTANSSAAPDGFPGGAGSQLA
ncbi:hypothetical protein TARUN_5390 [Trichoderma arundinaceum]|uniref:Uncharacterized protein n=1 Tax=Trichoderma arundinaceum TaxID=490622 RepID=A0A395NLK7_TRIAR|nr:hypothetical protein TARUN_5390 [Trichoderma arundinaceum]